MSGESPRPLKPNNTGQDFAEGQKERLGPTGGEKVKGEGPGTGAEYDARAAATTSAADYSILSVSAESKRSKIPDATNFTTASDNEDTSEQPVGNYWDPQRPWAFSHLQQKRESSASKDGSTDSTKP